MGSGILGPISVAFPASVSQICSQPWVQNEMTAVTLSTSITFVHETPGSGKSSLNLAGNYLGMALLGTGAPLAGDQCCCWAVPCRWFSSLHIQAFGSSSWKCVWVRSPLSWRDSDSSSGVGGAPAVGGSRQVWFHFCGLESMLDVFPNTRGFPGFSWSPLMLFLCLLLKCIPLSYKTPKTAVS